MTCRALRPMLVWLATTLGSFLVVRWALAAPVGASTQAQELVTHAAGWALVGCAGWCWLVTTLVIGSALRHSPTTAVRGVPDWARRFVLLACGLALVGSGTAMAETGRPHPPVSGDPVVAGLRLPDRTVGPALGPDAPAVGSAWAAATGAVESDASQEAASLAVRPGDSLWSIAAGLAGAHASTAEVAALTADLYRLNRSTIGPDPDLVLPGQQLRTPSPDRR